MNWRLLLSVFFWLACSLTAVFAAEPNDKKFDPSASYAHTKLFGLEAQGNKFVYVFDRSASMGDNGDKPLREAKKQLLASLNDLDESSQFYLIFYNDQPRLFDLGSSHGRLIFASDANKRQAADFISSMEAGGGTDHMAALTLALRQRPDVIFLLTDGEQKDDPTPDDLKRIDRLNGGGTIIDVIQFADKPRPTSSLIQLAHENRGQHVFVDIQHYGENNANANAKPK
ncbi:MAG TPA: VWA domain-containing protein [Pirellulales bacterium]|jgi:Mg-chelatase subunit ChlD|nr:VWA domain-containing protein [Pirellulales bacterium]